MGMARRSDEGRRLWQRLSSGGALRRGVEVLRQQPRRVRNTLETRDAAHVHNVWRSLTFNDVHAVEINAERAAALQGISRNSGESMNNSPCFSSSVRRGNTFFTPKSCPPIA